MKRYLLFVGSPYDDNNFGWGAFYNSYDTLSKAAADGEELRKTYTNGGAYHVVDAKTRIIVENSR